MSASIEPQGLCYPLGVFEFPVPGRNEWPASGAHESGATLPERTIETMSGSELLDLEIPPPEMLIESLWQVEGCGYLAGEPKCFKTFTIFDTAISIVSGQAVFGKFQVLKPGPVILFLEETKLGEAKQRLERLARGRGLTGFSVQDLHLAVQQGVRLDRDAEWDEVRRRCDQIRPRMVFFDPLARMHEGPENSQEEMGPILTRLRRLQVEFGTGVALTHHLSKPNADSNATVRTGHRIRGSGDQYAWVDCAMYFTRARGRERVKIEVEHREASAPAPFSIELEPGEVESKPAFRLAFHEEEEKTGVPSKMTSAVLAVVTAAQGGMKTRDVHEAVKGRGSSVTKAIGELVASGELIPRAESLPDSSGRMHVCKVLYAREHAPAVPEDV